MAFLKHIDFEVPAFGELSSPPIAVPSYPDAVLAMSPLAYWRMGEQSGTTLADETGSYPFTLTGDYTLAQQGAIHGDADAGVYFDGGRASANSPVIPSGANDPFSIAFWTRVPAAPIPGGAIMSQYSSATTGGLRLQIAPDGRLLIRSVNQFSFYSNGTIATDWRFVVVTRASDGVLRWFVDGELDTQQSGGTGAISPIDFGIGQPLAGATLVYLDELAVLDRALSLQEVRWLHGLGRAELSLPVSY